MCLHGSKWSFPTFSPVCWREKIDLSSSVQCIRKRDPPPPPQCIYPGCHDFSCEVGCRKRCPPSFRSTRFPKRTVSRGMGESVGRAMAGGWLPVQGMRCRVFHKPLPASWWPMDGAEWSSHVPQSVDIAPNPLPSQRPPGVTRGACGQIPP